MIWRCLCGEINLGVAEECRKCGSAFHEELKVDQSHLKDSNPYQDGHRCYEAVQADVVKHVHKCFRFIAVIFVILAAVMIGSYSLDQYCSKCGSSRYVSGWGYPPTPENAISQSVELCFDSFFARCYRNLFGQCTHNWISYSGNMGLKSVQRNPCIPELSEKGLVFLYERDIKLLRKVMLQAITLCNNDQERYAEFRESFRIVSEQVSISSYRDWWKEQLIE